MDIISRKEARALGLNKYFTGKACKHGHVAPRFIQGNCSGCLAVISAKWARDNKPKARAKHQRWYARNKEKGALATRRWQAENPGVIQDWRDRNKDKVRSYVRNRRAKLRAAPGTHSDMDIQQLWRVQRGRCAYCKTDLVGGFHVDHIHPVSRGGSNWPANLQLCCDPCNRRKGARDPAEFARAMGLLL